MNSMDKKKISSGRQPTSSASPSTPQRQSRRLSDVVPSAPLKRPREQPLTTEGVSGEAAVNNMDVSEEDRILHKFDLAMKYGPCANMSRLERWQRAEKFGLDPPLEVLEILQKYDADHKKMRSIWTGRV